MQDNCLLLSTFVKTGQIALFNGLKSDPLLGWKVIFGL
jgi:hypothetical protein